MNTATLSSYDRGDYLKFTDPYILKRDLQILVGIVSGISADEKVNEQEYLNLKKWVKSTEINTSNPVYFSILEELENALSDGIITTEEKENILWLCKQMIDKDRYYTAITVSIQSLVGILKGITFDEKINEKEIKFLDSWIEANIHLKNSWPYDELSSVLLHVMEDGVITRNEHNYLLAYCKSVAGDAKEDLTDNSIAEGFCQVDPNIIIPNHTFCLTGRSSRLKRREIAEKIELYGGFFQNNVSSKLNYLIICDEKNSCWAFNCYGRKVELANFLRRKGIPLAIVHEVDLFDALTGME